MNKRSKRDKSDDDAQLMDDTESRDSEDFQTSFAEDDEDEDEEETV